MFRQPVDPRSIHSTWPFVANAVGMGFEPRSFRSLRPLHSLIQILRHGVAARGVARGDYGGDVRVRNRAVESILDRAGFAEGNESRLLRPRKTSDECSTFADAVELDGDHPEIDESDEPIVAGPVERRANSSEFVAG